MQAPGFEDWIAQLGLLNDTQRRQVLAALHPAAGLDRVIALIQKIGTAKRCCQCGRTFNDLSGTPLARLRLRGKWLAYLEALLESRPVRQAADRVGVHRNTAFRWRHRFLHRVKDDRPAQLTGIVEADEMFILESQKGSRKLDRPACRRGGKATKPGISNELDCILVARDRNGQTIDAVTGRGALKVVQLEQHLLPKFDRQGLLATDSNAAYRPSPAGMGSRTGQ